MLKKGIKMKENGKYRKMNTIKREIEIKNNIKIV